MTDTWQSLDPKGHSEAIQRWLEIHNFSDSSWHNDISPSFQNDARELRLWIDNLAEDEREESGWRFELHQYNDGEFTYSLGACEEWEPMRQAIEGLLGLQTRYPAQILGEPVRHTDLRSNHVQDITGLDPNYPDDYRIGGAQVVAALIYHESLYILEMSDGTYWTIIDRSEYHGALKVCERALATFAASEGYGD